MRIVVAIAAIALLVAAGVPVQGATPVKVPAGTKVLLKFLTPVDSAKAKEGDTIKFEVAVDTLLDRTVVFRQGTAGQGIVTDVSPPGIFGKNARVHIAYIQVNAVDGKPVRLSPLDVTPDSVRQVQDVGGAGATAITGAILLGPIGIAAGALVRGGNVSLPAGAVGTTSLPNTITVEVP